MNKSILWESYGSVRTETNGRTNIKKLVVAVCKLLCESTQNWTCKKYEYKRHVHCRSLLRQDVLRSLNEKSHLFVSDYSLSLKLKCVSSVNNIYFRDFYLNFERASQRFSKKVQVGKMLCRERNEKPPCTS
jgi:hypothetical protein